MRLDPASMRPRHEASEIPRRRVLQCQRHAASMRPRHEASEIPTPTSARPSSRSSFNEAEARGLGNRDARLEHSARHDASMRPRHEASEIPIAIGLTASPTASFNEAEARGLGNRQRFVAAGLKVLTLQ